MLGYCGLPGSGKSYGAVENVILGSIKSKRLVYTNIALKLDVIKEDYPDAKIVLFTNEDVMEDENFLINIPHGAVIVLDEAWRFWPSGLAVNKMSEAHKSFFTEHRHRVGEDHYTTEIVLITQDFAQVCNFVRSLISDTYRTVKLSSVGLKDKYRVDVYSGCVTGPNPPKTSRNRQLFGRYKPSVYRYYSSHTKNNTNFESGLEEKPDRRNNFFKSGTFILFIASIFGFVFLVNYIFTDFLSPDSLNVNKDNRPKPEVSQVETSADSGYSTPVMATRKSNKETVSWVLRAVVGHVALVYSSEDNMTRSISINDCEIRDFEYFCDVDGQVVTRWN